MMTSCGTHGVARWGSTKSAANGETSMRQRLSAISPLESPRVSCSRSGRAARTARAVSTKESRSSTVRVARTLLATSDPIAAKEIAITLSATSASIIVKPASEHRALPSPDRRNFGYSREPVHPHLKTCSETRQPDDPSTRHPRGEVANGRTGRSVVAARGEQRLYGDIGRKAQNTTTRARLDDAGRRIDHCCDLSILPLRGSVVGIQQGGGL